MIHRTGDTAPSVPHQPFLSIPVDAATMNAIEHALLAVRAADNGDTTTAREQLSWAQRHARTTARRERQIVQIAALVVGGAHERAAGLSLEHAAQFPDDAELLHRVTGGATTH
jgi:acyl-CoA reductase-like NAD-dependent aldehyde dehydrogenase